MVRNISIVGALVIIAWAFFASAYRPSKDEKACREILDVAVRRHLTLSEANVLLKPIGIKLEPHPGELSNKITGASDSIRGESIFKPTERIVGVEVDPKTGVVTAYKFGEAERLVLGP